MNQKIENAFNVALDATNEELNKSRELSEGFDKSDNSWDFIARFIGSLDEIRKLPGVRVKELLNGYAIINAPSNLIETIASKREIIFVEKPKALEFALLGAKRASCINLVQENDFLFDNVGLFGEGVIVGIVDSGIDYTNSVFRNEDGSTRILAMWDQVSDSVYYETEINVALQSKNPFEIIDFRDTTGHGTNVAGIAAGNFAIDKRNQLGIATKSSLIVVKMATGDSFPRTTQLMEGIDFVVRQANRFGMPLSLNLSFGNSYGSHDGTSLISTYLDSIIDSNRVSVQIGSGNEGDSAGHSGGFISGVEEIEFQVSDFQGAFNIQLWKDYTDIFEIEIEAPSGVRSSIISEGERIRRIRLMNTGLLVLYGMPKPFSRYQEIYIELLPERNFVDEGIWTIRIIPQRTVVGRYDLWLSNSRSLNINTRFLRPDPLTTLTIPGATLKAITVGAYDSLTDKIATFSGRGFTRENDLVKPDIVAPGVNISTSSVGGGVDIRSGTSMATPFVTGSVALLMEWGIVKGNDPYLYGEKIKSYLIRGARQLAEFSSWPNPFAGWGALCLSNSFPGNDF